MDNAIILIDSGVNQNLFSENLIENIEVKDCGKNVILTKCDTDYFGHGTAAMYQITSLYPKAKVYSIKILNTNGSTSVDYLIKALEHCKELDIKVINMSIAINNISVQNKKKLENICNELKTQGKILFSSVKNNEIKSLPAIFESVIGVRGAFFINTREYWFNREKEVQCIADCSPIATHRQIGKFLFFGGNSKACVNMSANFLCLLEQNVGNTDYLMLLDKNKTKNHWEEQILDLTPNDYLNAHCRHPPYNKDAHKKIKNILNKVNPNLIKKSIDWDENLFNSDAISQRSFPKILDFLESTFLIKIDDKKLLLSSFSSISSLYNIVQEGVEKT